MACLLVVGLSPSAGAVAPADGPLNRAITKVLATPAVTASTARVGVAVNDARTGAAVYLRNPGTTLAPASTQKLFTAVAGLQRLGKGYRWGTLTHAARPPVGRVLTGNVYLKGYGDPTLLESDLADVAAGYKARGITRITGAIVADATFFDDVRYNPYWSTAYRSDHYAAEVSALTLSPDRDHDAGTVIVTFLPGARAGAPAVLGVTPSSARAYVTLVNKTTTGAMGTSSTFAATRAAGTNTITLTGRVPRGRALGKEWVTISDPARYAATVLRVQFARAGITVVGGAIRGVTPRSAVPMTSHYSMTLGSLLTPFLKLSNNGHAEVITKTIGRRSGKPGNWADGTASIRATAASLGVSMGSAVLVDGSGLARANRLSAAQQVGLLHRVQAASWFSLLRGALPVAGGQPVRWTGGTLASRMPGVAARVQAKNGSLSGVSSLAGYATGADGRRYLFSMIGNSSGASTKTVEDRLGSLLAGWRMTNP